MAITTPARVRNRIQAAETDISDAVLNEFIAEQTSRHSSRCTRKKTFAIEPCRSATAQVLDGLTPGRKVRSVK